MNTWISEFMHHNMIMYNMKDIHFDICKRFNLSVIKLLMFLTINFKWTVDDSITQTPILNVKNKIK